MQILRDMSQEVASQNQDWPRSCYSYTGVAWGSCFSEPRLAKELLLIDKSYLGKLLLRPRLARLLLFIDKSLLGKLLFRTNGQGVATHRQELTREAASQNQGWPRCRLLIDKSCLGKLLLRTKIGQGVATHRQELTREAASQNQDWPVSCYLYTRVALGSCFSEPRLARELLLNS